MFADTRTAACMNRWMSPRAAPAGCAATCSTTRCGTTTAIWPRWRTTRVSARKTCTTAAAGPACASMLFRVPLRFLQLYMLRLGFLDGLAGLQICMITAFTSFFKQARLWELDNALPQPDPEVEAERIAA